MTVPVAHVTQNTAVAATPPRKWTVRALAGIAIYAALCAYGITLLPVEVWSEQDRAVFGVLGLFGAWRYAWWLTHVIRASHYASVLYPRRAALADDAWRAGWRPYRLHILLTIYREQPATLHAVLAAICREARDTGLPLTLWVGTKDPADDVLVERCLAPLATDIDVHVRLVRQSGDGKRNAMALILAAMARNGLSRDDLVAFMDSDFILSRGAFRACLPLFATDPTLQAVTTDEDADVRGPRWVQSWLDMRFAQRRLAMQSHSVSGRVLTLTGRFSVFRGTHITSPKFIRLVEHDMLDHWLWGRFRFLSGDDKSTWFALLSEGATMLYVPDAHGVTVEVFEGSSVHRMVENLRRWSGNMLRNGTRAIALGPRRMPLFIWWCLVDQRLAMWTMLFGPLAAIVGTLRFGPPFLLAYGLYVASTRLVVAVVLFCFSRRVDLNFTWTLYVNQLVNSVVKLYMIWRLPKQRWLNRGDQQSGADGGGVLGAVRTATAGYLTATSVALLLLGALILTGSLALPRLGVAREVVSDFALGR